MITNLPFTFAENHASHDHVAYWLHRLSSSVLNKFEKELLQRNVTYAQWEIMISIYRNKGSTPKEIAEYLAIDAAAVSRGAQRLIDKNILKKQTDHNDRRSVRLLLTAYGEDVMQDTLAICEQQEQLWLSELPPNKRQQFIELLYDLLRTQGITPTGAVWRDINRNN